MAVSVTDALALRGLSARMDHDALTFERFMRNVEIAEEGCWPWRGRIEHTGYGVFSTSEGENKRPRGAHRMMWQFAHKRRVPDGLFVCHRCDNPPCVRPNHLFLGTAADNVADMMAKGRARHVPRPWKLNESQVREIRQLWRSGRYTQRLLAEMFLVHSTTIHYVVKGQRWAHVVD